MNPELIKYQLLKELDLYKIYEYCLTWRGYKYKTVFDVVRVIDELTDDFFYSKWDLRATAGMYIVVDGSNYIFCFMDDSLMPKKIKKLFNSEKFEYTLENIKKYSLCYSCFNLRKEKLKKLNK